MIFANPGLFLLLFIIPALAVKYYFDCRKGENKIIYSMAGKIRGGSYSGSLRLRLRHVPFAVMLISMVFIITALARPQSYRDLMDEKTEGIDIMLALDISGTMLAEDFKPVNRIEAAKKVIENFIKGRKNDKIGLVIFSGKSYALCPLTLDYNILLNLLAGVKNGMIQDGTAIGMAIVNSVNRLKDAPEKSKIIILLTDGENNAGKIDPETASALSSSLGIRIYTIGVGKIGGAPIPVEDKVWGKRYATDMYGNLVLTKMDENALIKIAEATGGMYFRATNTEALKEIYKKIDAMEKSKIKVSNIRQYRELYRKYLFIGFIGLALAFIMKRTVFLRIP